MGYEEFKIMLKKILQEKMGNKVEVRFETLKKNNGTEVEAVTLFGGDALAPAPHIKDLYELYQRQDGSGGFDACIDMIEQLYASTDMVPIKRVFRPWEELEDEVKDKIMPVLINRKWNGGILKDTVYQDFLDLAVILRVQVLETSEGSGTVRVNKNILDIWGVSENELWVTAFRNLRKEKFVAEDLEKEISKILGATGILENTAVDGVGMPPQSHTPKRETVKEDRGLEKRHTVPEKDALAGESGVFQYVLTNSKRTYGAAGMLRTDLLQEVAEKEGCGLFILPSSVHEVLLLPDRGMFPAEMLRETIGAVNREQVADAEKLSDNLYYFRKGADKAEVF